MKLLISALSLGTLLLLVLQIARTEPVATFGEVGDKPAKNIADQKTTVEELKAEIKKLNDLVPDQAAVMTHVGYHWTNLWFALDKMNWPLADFYLSETRANLKWAVRAKPLRKTAAGVIDLGNIAQALDNTQLAQLKEAISKKDRDHGIKLYDEAMQGCYACHKASEKPFLVLQRPQRPEVNVINFSPGAIVP